VIIQAGVPASTAGSNDASGTLRVHKDNFKLYNVNVKNTYGVGSQAIAISQYGSRVGLYACGFYGYQDTLYANEGTQVYLRGYIEVSRIQNGGHHIEPYNPNRVRSTSSSVGGARHILVGIPSQPKVLGLSLLVAVNRTMVEVVSE